MKRFRSGGREFALGESEFHGMERPWVTRRLAAATRFERSLYHESQIPPHRGRARPVVRHRPVRHRHVSARTAVDRRGSARRHRRRADEPVDLLPVDGLRPDRRRADLRHGRPQAAALWRPRAVHGRRHRFGDGADHRMADRLPLPAGPRRQRRHGGAARHRARPAHRHRSRQADVAADAGVFGVADPGAADRQPDHREFRLARRVLDGDGCGAAGHHPAGDLAQGDAAGRKNAPAPPSAPRSPAIAS